ncbi:MAG: DMT family transporter [Burkholderiaceae bacterium]|nr:DMT family transporter [Burkholderiaceae bacterium]MDO9090904.1 DMT family transporter [Burkholderiaceae bacterium]MDP1968335.1 DMT family transporter [Burkholderiaceae bacterium]
MKRTASALTGIALMIMSMALLALMDTTGKALTGTTPVLMVLFFRYFFQAVITTAVVLPTQGRAVIRTAHPRFQVVRGSLLFSCTLLSLYSLKYLPVGEFTAIVKISPLVITLFAAITLHERVSGLRWVLVFGGFLGTLLIVRPGGASFSWAMLLPLCMVALTASFQVLTSKMSGTEKGATTHFYTGWVGTLLAAIPMAFSWQALPLVTWGMLILMGVLGTTGHYLLILAYSQAPASTLTPYLYGQIGFAMLGGWLVFDHLPDAWSLAGIGLIAFCGAAGAWWTAREGRVLTPAASPS